MTYLSWSLAHWLKNPAISVVLWQWNWITSPSDYLGGLVGFVDWWIDGISQVFTAANWLFLMILFILLLWSVFISQSSK